MFIEGEFVNIMSSEISRFRETISNSDALCGVIIAHLLRINNS